MNDNFSGLTFQFMVEASPAAQIVVTDHAQIIFMNKVACNLFGYTAEEMYKQPISILVPSRFNRTHSGYSMDFLNAPTDRQMGDGKELYALRKDGSEFPVRIGLNVLPGKTNKLVMATVLDLSQQKENDNRIQGYIKEIERQNKVLKEFGYIVSHDLSEPLRTIAGYISILKEEHANDLNREGSYMLSAMENAAVRLRKLVDHLLESSRTGISGVKSLISLDRVLFDVMASLELIIEKEKVTIAIDSLPTVMAYPIELGQLFQNLLQNAIKFRRADVPLSIKINSTSIGGYWLISIEDNGIGISSNHLDRIFHPFETLSKSTGVKGYGIGLANCRRIVEHHQGKIWAESVEGQGTIFRFTLPAEVDFDAD